MNIAQELSIVRDSIAEYGMTNITQLEYDEIYEQGRADYEAECKQIFEDNPPMHFSHEQIMWLKEFVKIRCNQARVDAIDECIKTITDYCGGLPNGMYVNALEQLLKRGVEK